MLMVVISPSKGQDFETPAPTTQFTSPEALSETKKLIKELRDIDSPSLQELMSISPKLGDLNVERFQKFKTPFSLKNAKQALFAFKGDVYSGIESDSFSEADLAYAQDHLRMLSGLYGALRPLDLIQPYRLEMKTRLANPRGENLYQFWGDRITESLNGAMSGFDDPVLINLASNEYFKAVKPKLLKAPLLTINFKEVKDGKARVIAIFAKRARGMMTDYIVRNRIESPEGLKGFRTGGYRFSSKESDDKQWTFTRKQQ